ncbi:hypothetical protein [Xenorhabdus sp. PB62.4]|uniref:hypothetical protein n=1 Tax=Xenorhabdus sp. PB62.4 TaxID=1851573 RepID=UPI0016571A22|nr:hypothetical protein [Xenorhabdus sp. PB62.4]MBC8954443.1 hypothetical protein [Xenorhabdus sp. PB62.4]
MHQKNKQIILFIVASIMWTFSLFLIFIFGFFVGKCVIWLFMSGEFFFSFEYVKKAFRAAIIAGPILGIGTWIAYYHPFKRRR